MQIHFLQNLANVSVAALFITTVAFNTPGDAAQPNAQVEKPKASILQKLTESDTPEAVEAPVTEDSDAAAAAPSESEATDTDKPAEDEGAGMNPLGAPNPEEELAPDSFEYEDLLGSQLLPETQEEMRAVERLEALMEDEGEMPMPDEGMGEDSEMGSVIDVPPESEMEEMLEGGPGDSSMNSDRGDADAAAAEAAAIQPTQSLSDIKIIRPTLINITAGASEDSLTRILPQNGTDTSHEGQQTIDQESQKPESHEQSTRSPKLMNSAGVRIIRMGEPNMQESGFTIIKGFDS